MPKYEFEITERSQNVGGGWKLRLIEDGQEVGGGVFPDYDDALCEADDWLSTRPRSCVQ